MRRELKQVVTDHGWQIAAIGIVLLIMSCLLWTYVHP